MMREYFVNSRAPVFRYNHLNKESHMTSERLDHYRSLVKLHHDINDPLIAVRTDDLRAMLDCYQWFNEDRQRIRRKAPLTESELAE